VGLIGAAAVFGGILLARVRAPAPAPFPFIEHGPGQIAGVEDDEIFSVASASEIHIIRVDVQDADRIVMDQPLIGTFELAAPEDINIVKVERNPDEGPMPRLQRRAGVPMIVIVRPEEEEEQDP